MIDFAALSDLQLQQMAVSGNREAEEVLVGRYMQLVRACSRPFFLAGGESEDLIQEGMFGLISAIRQYDPGNGAAFHTFAEHCIKRRLLSAIRSASRMKHFPLNDGLSLEQLSEDMSVPFAAIPDYIQPSPEELVLARENKEELYSAFQNRLSKFEIQVLDLYLDG
ncbi:MAG: sigma-70 family RNA polymerase sigma factor, partial [Ruminococcus sp.]|nr:sigma-70 family RNA polymerase sigma factor [Ruminococcus sp.]